MKIGNVFGVKPNQYSINDCKWLITDIKNGQYKCVGINNSYNKNGNIYSDLNSMLDQYVVYGSMNINIFKILYSK